MKVLTTVACVVLAFVATVQGAGREVTPLDFDWRFHLGEVEGARADVKDSDWRVVDLPHDFGVEGDYDQKNPGQGGYLPGGIGWYRRVVEVPKEWVGQHVTVEFDAACMNSRVYWNGTEVGGRPYGYISFGCDVSKVLKPGPNLLAVRVDTSKLPNGRWYMGSGIYSHVRVVKSGTVHLARHGVTVTTPVVSDKRAVVKVAVEVEGDGGRVETEILDPDGRPVGKGNEVEVRSPALWSPESPRLYRAVVRVYRGADLVDEVSETFGIRAVRWDANTGFWLNGRNVKLKGMCMHWDAGGALGVAVPDSVAEWRLRELKAMGCNAVRTGHTPFPPAFYEACDRIGLMVLDEAFDGWRRKARFDYGAEYYKDWWKRDLSEMIRRDHNHPCVVAWSVGNETGERDVNGMTEFAHSIDPTRSVTGGQLLEGVDVAGFTGKGETPGVLDQFHQSHPKTPVVLTEETHTYSTRGHYRVVTHWRDAGNEAKRQPFIGYGDEEVFVGGDPQWESSYDNSIVRMSCRQCTKRTMNTPWIAGEFKWAAFDYLGEAQTVGRHWPMRYGTMGVIDSALFRKDTFYFYQSQYTTAPMVHLLPDWSLAGRVTEGAAVPVVAYSNCDEVELFQDGKSLARKRPSELLDFVWNAKWQPGELRAAGYRGGRKVAEDVEATARPPERLALSADHAELGARGDMVLVAVEARDAHDQFVPTANQSVEFAVLGKGGRWTGAENGCPTDVSNCKLPHRDLFAGKVRGYVVATGEEGPVALVAGVVFVEGAKARVAVEELPLRAPKAGTLTVTYSVDGSEPTTVYAGPVTVRPGQVIKVRVDKDGSGQVLRMERTVD